VDMVSYGFTFKTTKSKTGYKTRTKTNIGLPEIGLTIRSTPLLGINAFLIFYCSFCCYVVVNV